MLRPANRLVSFILLFTVLLGVLPIRGAEPSATAAPSSTLPAVQLQTATTHIPTPSQAVSSALSASSIAAMRSSFGATHTANGALDGTYSHESVEDTYVYPGTISAATKVSAREWYVVHEAAAGPFTHDALTLDFSAAFANGNVGTNVYSYLSVWDPITETWGQDYVLKRTAFDYLAPTEAHSGTGVQVSLGLVPARSAVRIRLRCLNTYATGTITKCEMSNLHFANQVPNWLRFGTIRDLGNQIEEPSRMWEFRVGRTALDPAISAQTNPFFSVDIDHTGSFPRSIFRYHSPLIRLPNATAINRFSASLRYAQQITTGSKTAGQTQINFIPADGTFAFNLLTIPETTTSNDWRPLATPPDKIIKGSSLSGKLGWIEIQKWPGTGNHVLALDTIALYLDGKPIPLPPDQLLGKCTCTEGGRTQHIAGDPVNTYSGAYYLHASDLTTHSRPPLSFERTYTSLLADPARYAATTLGPGWRHPFAETLITEGIGSETNTIIYEAATGNRLRFYVDAEGKVDKHRTPHAAPGVRATLATVIDPILQRKVYVLRSTDQWLKIFDPTTKRLLERRTPGGDRQVLTYYQTPGQIQDGQLQEVMTLTPKNWPTQKLRFTYGHYDGPRLVAIEQVPDTPTTQPKRVTFRYTPEGALERVMDLHGGTTTYSYEAGSFRLSGVHHSAQGQHITNSYTDNRVSKQVEPGGLTTTYAYTVTDGLPITTVKRWRSPAMQEPPVDMLEDHYRADGTLEYQIRNGAFASYTTFDSSLALAVHVDARGHVTKAESTSAGLPHTITDALAQQTTLRYDRFNHPLDVQGPDGVIRALAYDANGNLIRSTLRGHDGLQQTTIYTYTSEHTLSAEQRPDGVVTTYDYNLRRQRVRTTVNPQHNGYQSSQPDTHLVTEYGYDGYGRLITTTVGVGTGLERTDTTTYNPDDTIARTIQNYQNGIFDSKYPDQDIITEYGYDQLGRQIFIKDVFGRYDVTIYTANGQVAETIRNCRAASGLPVASGCAPFDPAAPDRNVVTRYSYDALQRTAFITETGILTGSFDLATHQFSATTDRTTHIEYDRLSRPVTVTLKYQPGQPNYDPSTGTGDPTINLQELTYYDDVHHAVWQRDVFGRWTHTQNDALGRPVRTIANYEDGNPSTVQPANHVSNGGWTDGSDTDIVAEQQYRPDGQLARLINNRVTGIFSLKDLTADRTTEYQYDSLGRPMTTIANVFAESTRTDTNRATATAYHPQTGRVQGQQDALGRWLSFRYDALGRITETIQNCRAAGSAQPPADCSDPTKPTERNVRNATRYDALGRMVDQIDALGHSTHTDYDGLGRVITTTVNYDPSGTDDADTNVKTIATYDALGRTIAMTDPAGAVTRTEYDSLGRAIATSDAAGRVTRTGYDATGAVRWRMTPDGRVTVYQVEGLGRVVTTIANYQNGVAEPADGTDRDVITSTQYDVAGRKIATIDASGRRTILRYDLRDQLTQVVENVRADCTDPNLAALHKPCNVTSTYTYDRAGNRTAVTDPRNATRRMVYDAADRLTHERDALDHITSWEYNRLDQPTTKHDPRGSAYDVNYTYDELGRRTGTSATTLDAPVTEYYDALGRRVQLQDGTGTTTFQYDDLHRVTTVQQPSGTVGYSYTARGERSQLRYPSGATVDYHYTPVGQMERVQEGATILASYAYDGLGRLARVTRGNGAVTTYAYDGLDRLFDLTTRMGGDLRSRYQYTLDRAGLRTNVVETFPADTSQQSILIQNNVAPAAVQPTAAHALEHLAFVPNQGQTDRRVAFLARHQGGMLFLSQQGMTLSLPTAPEDQVEAISDDPAGNDPGLPLEQRRRATPAQHTAVRVEWLRANPRPTITPDGTLPGTINDLRGNNPAAWRRNLPSYAGVRYTALYDGIDLRYDGDTGALKGTYTIAPGRDPGQIRWRYLGAKDTRLDDSGNLVVTLPAPKDHTAPTLTEAAPIAWQDSPQGRVAVPVRYHLAQDGTVGFTVGTYDTTQPLIIDPTLSWSTTLSGSQADVGWGIAVDSSGAIYLTGETASADFPQNLGVYHGGYDAFVTKLSADGTQTLWQTLVGGSGNDWGRGIAVDPSGRAVIVGITTSDNLGTTSNAVQATYGGGLCGAQTDCTDAFIMQIAADGNALRYSSYLGGSKDDSAQRVALATNGDAVLVGETASATFRTTSGAWQQQRGDEICIEGTPCTDAFVTRIDLGAATSTAALRWSTRIGGTGADSAWGVAVDSVGDVVVTGLTAAENLPLVNAADPSYGGAIDAFVTKLSGDGTTARWSTYLGSTAADYGRDVAVDASGDVYVTGWTYSSLFPTTPGSLQSALAGESDAFLTKLSAASGSMRWSTFVGGSDNDYSFALVVDSTGNSTIVGSTVSTDLPVVRPIQHAHAGPVGQHDLLLASLRPDGQAAHLVSYLGSSSSDGAADVTSTAAGGIRVTGSTRAVAFPSGSTDPSGTSNAFVVALDNLTTPGGEPIRDQRTVSYQYDALRRLTEATESPGTSERYSYDLAGNRTEVWENGTRTTLRAYNAANQVSGVPYQYDQAGNLITDGTHTFAYDALNRLTSAATPGNTTTYRYTGDNVLTSQTTNGTTATYTQDVTAPLSQILERSAGGTTSTYRYGRDRLAEVMGGTRTWYTTDGLGSVRQTLSDTGNPLSRIDYDPWGTPKSSTQMPTFGFTGELQNTFHGLVHLRARWYQPGHAAFTAADTHPGYDTISRSLNRYLYSWADPVNLTDHSGRSPFGTITPAEGLFIHAMIQMDYDRTHPGGLFDQNALAGESGPAMFVDIISDFQRREIYEIKPAHQSGDKQLAKYITAMNIGYKAYAPWKPGWNYPVPPKYVGPWPVGLDPTYNPSQHGVWAVYIYLEKPGIIKYKGVKVAKRPGDPVSVALPTYDIDEVEDFVQDKWARLRQDNWKQRKVREGIQPPPPYQQPLPGLAAEPGWNMDPYGTAALVIALCGTAVILLDPVPGDEAFIPLLWTPVGAR